MQEQEKFNFWNCLLNKPSLNYFRLLNFADQKWNPNIKDFCVSFVDIGLFRSASPDFDIL